MDWEYNIGGLPLLTFHDFLMNKIKTKEVLLMNGTHSSDIFLLQTLIVISTFLYKSITQITPLHKVRVTQ